MTTEILVAQALIEIQAVGFVIDHPITFKSGIQSPVYVDNRRFPFFPPQWGVVITSFGELLVKKKISFDVIAGIETAGIPHSAALGYSLKKPSVFIRKAAKDHGTKKLIEGGEVSGKRVILIEDHITTGGSSLHGVQALKEAGASVVCCLAITSYGFSDATDAFATAGVPLYTLTSFSDIVTEAVKQKKLTPAQVSIVHEWMNDPQSWGKKGTL